MSTVPTHNPVPAPPTVPPVLKCQTCQVPLTDATWKNCAECRRKRTESYNHWKNSTSLTSVPVGMMNIMNLNSSTPSQASAPTAPLGRHSNELSNYGGPSRSSQLANDLNDQSGWISASTARPPPKAIEYQWSEELIVDLLALPPRSRFAGKFSIVADPAVNNSKCARLFSEQLFARGLPISGHKQLISLDEDTSSPCSFLSHCTCQEGCRGRFIVSVGDDMSHPYGIPGQLIGVVVVHPSPPD